MQHAIRVKLESPSSCIMLRCRGGDTQAVTPFAVGCQRMGLAEIGGKLDDVAVSCLHHHVPKALASLLRTLCLRSRSASSVLYGSASTQCLLTLKLTEINVLLLYHQVIIAYVEGASKL